MGVVILLYLIVEIAAVVAVASAVGLMWTLALLLGGAVLGSWLARREGGRAMRAVVAAANAGRAPHSEVTDSMLVGLGGLLILLPGFVSDALGILVLLPPTRGVLRSRWERSLEKRADGMRTARMGRHGVVVDGEVVDGEVVDDSPPKSDRQNRPIIEPGQ
ncbi:MAG: FxsA family protein [Pseudonocardiaceae bacterium]|nr:FxsA family protein [Pseudonocardiaceae bacterium]